MAFSWNPFANRKAPEPIQEQTDVRNPNYEIFNSVNNDIARVVASRSIVSQDIQKNEVFANPVWNTFFQDGMLAMPITTNKAERIAQYRSMAKLSETQWCLDEIADDFINEDEHGDFIKLKLPDGKDNINETRKGILQNEFKKYMSLFRMRENGYTLIKRFLVEGELAWENVINSKHPENGIIGVKFLPAEYYETLLDQRTNETVGIIFDTKKFSTDIKQILSNNYLGSAQVFNAISPTTTAFTFDKKSCIPMLWSQLTYINSGEYSHDGLISYPIMEKAKQAYYQFSLLKDAAVILRVTRAPERLLFNISTGKMNQNYAEEAVRNFANALKQRKVASPDGKDIAGVYNPQGMLEHFIFSKSDGNDGTTIETVNSTAAYDQIEDIKFFLKLYVKQFKVPFSRFEQPENAKPADDQIATEEYSFLQQEVRFQRRFAKGFREGFITHLKLRDIWQKYELNEADIEVEFVRPSLYDLYNTQKIVETKMAVYKAALGDDNEFSRITAMKKYLGFTDAEVKENFMNLILEKQYDQLKDYWADQLNKNGPAGEFDKSPLPIKGSEEEQQQEQEEQQSQETEASSEEGAEEASGTEKQAEENAGEESFGLK